MVPFSSATEIDWPRPGAPPMSSAPTASSRLMVAAILMPVAMNGAALGSTRSRTISRRRNW